MDDPRTRAAEAQSARPARIWLRLFVLGLVVLALGVAAHVHLSAEPLYTHPAISDGTSVDDLLRVLLLDSSGADQERILGAFADTRRPDEGCRALASRNGRVVVLVAANGTWTHRDGYDAVWDREGEDVDLVVLIAGRGKSVGLFGRGGRGGRARTGRVTVGAGGGGGSGLLLGGDGGNGGQSLPSSRILVGANANGGPGGGSLLAAGHGGRGGTARLASPGAPGLLGRSGDGGRGLVGGAGGGDD
ncbi:MAG: hypothetical protein HYZ53_17225 [Planctomycetes bacterium]|nr:hypothetical protein [Planctomycetota bacterium]